MADFSGSVSSLRKGDPFSKRTFNIKLTFSALVTAGIVLFIGVAWSFVLGVMVGRGYNPEKKIPQLASLLPDERKPVSPPANIVEQLPKGEVMKPEDLEFMVSLKGKGGEKNVPAKNATADPKMRPLSNAMQHVQSGTAGAAATGTDNSAVQPANSSAAKPAVKPAPPPKQDIFDFTYQVATFKEMESVEKLRASLEGHGLRSRVQKDGKLLKVIVLYRGSEDGAKGARQIFNDLGLGQPLQRGKKPVGKSSGKK